MNKYFLATALLTSLSNQCLNEDAFNRLKQAFEEREAWGIELTLDVHNCNPDTIRSKEKITQYVHELCELIEMKRFGDTEVVHFGEDEKVAGYSMTQLIETSLISGHFANATNAAYINIFSCKLYNPEIVKKFTEKFFEGSDSWARISLRK